MTSAPVASGRRPAVTALRRFLRAPTAVIGLALMALLILGAVFAREIAPQNPFDLAAIDVLDARLPPGSASMSGDITYWLGTDGQGRDLFSAILYGLRTSLTVGVGSALFGPIKYAILPEQLSSAELPAANAWIEGATFIAILTGTIFAGISFAGGGDHPAVFGPLVVGFAAIAWGASCLIPRTGPAAPGLTIDANILRSTMRLTREICGERRMLVTSLMVSWFWLMGAIMLSILPPLVKSLGGGEIIITAYLTVFAIAIALGSSIAAWLSAGRIVLLHAVVGTVRADQPDHALRVDIDRDVPGRRHAAERLVQARGLNDVIRCHLLPLMRRRPKRQPSSSVPCASPDARPPSCDGPAPGSSGRPAGTR